MPQIQDPVDVRLRRVAGSLTPEQVRAYDEEGYLVLPRFLSEIDLEGVVAAMSHKVDRIAERLLAEGKIEDTMEGEPFDRRLARLFDGLSDADFLRSGRGWRDRHPGYYHLMSSDKILDAIESLIGPEVFSNPVYNVRPKVPRVAAGAVPWHQDKSYWPDANANPVITAWIAVAQADLENGCLHIWPRTHRRDVLASSRETYSGTGYLEIEDAEWDKGRAEREAVPIPLEAGGMILFNDRCIHMSTPNRSDRVRWSVDLRYQPTDQDPMPQHGIGFLARSAEHPERVADLDDWLAYRMEHGGEAQPPAKA